MYSHKKLGNPDNCDYLLKHPKSKRLLIVSDFHAGHKLGLAVKEDCVNQYQKEGWRFFIEGIKKYAPFDIILANGDLLDGKETKCGGRECITTDLQEQSEMASRIIQEIVKINRFTPRVLFTFGTPYHVGSTECNFESIIASQFRSHPKDKNIDNRLLVKVNDVVIDLRHKVGSSAMPHTKLSPVGREIVFGMLKEVAEQRAAVDLYIRSHVHYFVKVEMMNRIALSTPALQINSDYGMRECNGITDFGFLVCDIQKQGKDIHIIKHISPKPIKKEWILKV